MDSVPLVVITGQVPRGVIGTDSFQESDIVGITMPVVKHSYLLQSTDELTATFREAFHIAKDVYKRQVLDGRISSKPQCLSVRSTLAGSFTTSRPCSSMSVSTM